ncbi:hypothetical protein [Micromonospora tulbaghiae]|uniref:hypothetical protein n=1 Tax=Micromonospora tulbaghiae TaxID=479978 RepID=UPI00340391C5
MSLQTDCERFAFLGGMVAPDGPDDHAAHAHNNYVLALWAGEPIHGKTAREWLDEARRLDPTHG